MRGWPLRPAPRPIRAYTPHGGSFNYQPGSLIHSSSWRRENVGAAHRFLPVRKRTYRQQFDAHVGASAGVTRVVVNGLGADGIRRRFRRADAADFLYVGELREAKGVDTLLEALALVARETAGAARGAGRLGPGPGFADRACRKVSASPVTVSFPGPMPARQAFRLGRTLVVPSRAESMPYVVLEAAAARMPMIATNVGGIPEIFGPLSRPPRPERRSRRPRAPHVRELRRPAAESARAAAELADYVAKTSRSRSWSIPSSRATRGDGAPRARRAGLVGMRRRRRRFFSPRLIGADVRAGPRRAAAAERGRQRRAAEPANRPIRRSCCRRRACDDFVLIALIGSRSIICMSSTERREPIYFVLSRHGAARRADLPGAAHL